MIALIKFLFLGHSHKWKIIKENDVYEKATDKVPIATLRTLQCEHCGNLKYTRTDENFF